MELKTVLVSAFIAFGLSAILSQVDLRGGASTPSAAASVVASQTTTTATGASYSALLDDLDGRIHGLQERANGRADDWLIRMHLGTMLLERASLTNQLRDFERVQALLDDAFAIAPAGSGPVVLAARFNFSIHRLKEAEKYLDVIDRRAVPRREDLAVARVLRAEIALQRGQYEEALKGLTEVAAVEPVAANTELALYHAKTGNPALAETMLQDALEATNSNDPRRRAWMRLQLGILAMDRGDLLLALERLKAADAELSGWWLVQEHIAEVHNRRAEHDKAVAIYEDLVRMHDLPQHMDALASLYKHMGERAKADELVARAAARWAEQLERLPESAMGHGLQHELELGTPERAVELALANYAARPGGDAQVLLARAYLQAGRPADALAVAEQALASPYRTARLHDVAAKAHEALGHTAAAQEQVALRLAINPQYSSDDHSH